MSVLQSLAGGLPGQAGTAAAGQLAAGGLSPAPSSTDALDGMPAAAAASTPSGGSAAKRVKLALPKAGAAVTGGAAISSTPFASNTPIPHMDYEFNKVRYGWQRTLPYTCTCTSTLGGGVFCVSGYVCSRQGLFAPSKVCVFDH